MGGAVGKVVLRRVQDPFPCGWRGSPPTAQQQVWLGACSERCSPTLPPTSPGSCQGPDRDLLTSKCLSPTQGSLETSSGLGVPRGQSLWGAVSGSGPPCCLC